jgi:hypothetical protein
MITSDQALRVFGGQKITNIELTPDRRREDRASFVTITVEDGSQLRIFEDGNGGVIVRAAWDQFTKPRNVVDKHQMGG